jgi:hypothetical protein
VTNAYLKFSSRFAAASERDKPKTFASFATFADGGQNFGAQANAEKVEFGTTKIQSVPVKVAQVAKVETSYHGVSAEPDGTGCTVEIIELPQAERYRRPFGVLQLRPPALVEVKRWRQCVEDGKRFLAAWGSQAEALGWSSADLFGLHTPPAKPHPSYRRLSRYDANGLCWLLHGKAVIALTEATATIRNPATGSLTTYRRFNKPALGPLGDSLDDFK